MTPPPQGELVSVVIPARNEEAFIGDCLLAVRGQEYQNLQIIVVDGGSADGTVDVVKAQMAEDERIELLHNPRPNIPASLNLAVAQLRGRWMVRVDAHATVEPRYVSRLVERLADSGWGGVGGRKVGVGVTPAGKAIAAAMESKFGVGNSTYHHGTTLREVEHIPFGAYPVDVIRRLGGWDERLLVNQDYEFDHRVRLAGMPLLFDPQIEITWHCRQSIIDLFGQYLRYGDGKAVVMLMHPRSIKARHLLPPAFVVYAAAAAVLALARPSRAAAMLAPYAAAVAVASVHTARELDSVPARLRVAPAFLSMHLAWGLGIWRGLPKAVRSRVRGRAGARR
ncbi:MAG: glycosyltransferase family 2 protein [Geodermatophilaceae bacterium]